MIDKPHRSRKLAVGTSIALASIIASVGFVALASAGGNQSANSEQSITLTAAENKHAEAEVSALVPPKVIPLDPSNQVNRDKTTTTVANQVNRDHKTTTTVANQVNRNKTTTTVANQVNRDKTTTTVAVKHDPPRFVLQRPELYKVVARTLDPGELAKYSNEYGVSIRGAWSNNSDEYSVVHLRDDKEGKNVFVLVIKNDSYDVQVIPGAADASFSIGTLGVYEGKTYPLLQGAVSTQMWLIDIKSSSFIPVDSSKVTLVTP